MRKAPRMRGPTRILCYNNQTALAWIYMRPRTPFLSLTICLLAALVSFSQDKKPGEKDEVIRIETQLVDVPIAVTSSAGLPIRGLRSSNFLVYEDGKSQEIADFSTTTEPFEVAL